MRYLAIILSFLTIALSAIPCDDEVNNDIAIISIVTADTPTDSHLLGDLCSPFCTCVCCANVVVEPVFDQELTITDAMNTELNSTYLFSFSRDFSKSIFQPPQV
jgi:hypothetical protein